VAPHIFSKGVDKKMINEKALEIILRNQEQVLKNPDNFLFDEKNDYLWRISMLFTKLLEEEGIPFKVDVEEGTHYSGKYFFTRGPLATVPSEQLVLMYEFVQEGCPCTQKSLWRLFVQKQKLELVTALLSFSFPLEKVNKRHKGRCR
jgi:hypothetical protein